MRKGNLICGIDIGTSKVCVSAGEVSKLRAPKILAVSSLNYPDRESKEFIHFSDLEHLLYENFKSIQKELKFLPQRVYISFPPHRLRKYSTETTIPISTLPEKITKADSDRALKAISGLHLSCDERILCIFPREFFADQRRFKQMPQDTYARNLTLKADAVTINYKVLDEIKQIIINLGLSIEGCTLPALATSALLISPEDKQAGVILVDIGSQVTEIVYFRDGLIKSLEYIHKGGYDFTRKISKSFNIPLEKAEIAKRRYLSIDTPAMMSQENITIKNLPHPVTVSRNHFCQTVKPQIESFILELRKKIKPVASFYNIRKIVVAGGAPLIEGFLEKMQVMLELNISMGKPQTTSKLNLDPIQYTASGIVYWVAERQRRRKVLEKEETGVNKLLGGLYRLYKDYF